MDGDQDIDEQQLREIVRDELARQEASPEAQTQAVQDSSDEQTGGWSG